jgi:hypothetical protein
MKTIALLLTGILFTSSVLAGLPPTTLNSQQSGTKITTFNAYVPNNQATKVSGGTLIESGNNNILENPSFEHSTFDTGWIISAGTSSEMTNDIDNTKVFHGLKSMKVTMAAGPMDIIAVSSVQNQAYKDGVQGLATIRVKTSVTGIKVCSRIGFATSTTNCVAVNTDGKWGLYKVPFIMGEFNNGLAVTSQAVNVTGDVYIDEAFAGAQSLTQNIDASKIAGESYFAGTTGCDLSRTSTSVGAFTAVAACPGPTIESSLLGSWQTTDSNLIRQTINNLPAGKYKAKFITAIQGNGTNRNILTINDGITTCEPLFAEQSASTSGVLVECVFNYISSGDRVFELYGAATGGAINLVNSTASPRASTKFILEYFGSDSTYSSTNANYSRTQYTPTFTGFGAVTVHDCYHSRDGQYLDIDCKFTSGTTTAVEARLSLPGSLVSPVSLGIRIAGSGGRSANGATEYMVPLIESSASYFTFGVSAGAIAPLTKQNGSSFVSSGQAFAFVARIPIAGWENSNLIIGSFSGIEKCADSYECTDTFSAKVSNAGAHSGENVEWVTTSSNPSTGNYTLNIGNINGAGLALTSLMNCTCSVDTTTQSAGFSCAVDYANSTPTSIKYFVNANGVLQNRPASIICQKQGIDYVAKSARAVSSDLNVTSIGAVGADVQRVYFGASADCSTACTTGTCIICDQVGTKITSVSWVGTGQYNVNGVDGTKYACNGTAYTAAYLAITHWRDLSTASFARVVGGNPTSTNSARATVTCIGIP